MQSEFTGLSLIDVSKVKLPKHHRQNSSIKSYVIKVAALYATSFDEVLMLDSDNTPLVDPTTLFEEPSYLATGNAFWPDFATNTGEGSPRKVMCLQLSGPVAGQQSTLDTSHSMNDAAEHVLGQAKATSSTMLGRGTHSTLLLRRAQHAEGSLHLAWAESALGVANILQIHRKWSDSPEQVQLFALPSAAEPTSF